MSLKDLNFAQKSSIIAAIITAVATYMFLWCVVILPMYANIPVYVNGIGFIKNLSDLFVNYNSNTNESGLSIVVLYFAVLVIFLIFLASPILQILGIKRKEGPLIGCIMPLVISIFIVLYSIFGFASIFIRLLAVYMGDPAPVSELFPIPITIGERFELFGTYILMAGGVISLIAGLKGSRKF